MEERNTFTLYITDDGENFDIKWMIDPPWDGETAPPPSYVVGGYVINFLKDMLEEEESEDAPVD